MNGSSAWFETAFIVECPGESVIIQLHYKRRGGKGKLQERNSKASTVHKLFSDEVYQPIRAALTRT